MSRLESRAAWNWLRRLPTVRSSCVLFVDNQVHDFLRYRLGLAYLFREAGWEVHVAVPKESGIDQLTREDVKVHTFHIRRASTSPWDEFRCAVGLLRLYWRLRPALVHHLCLKPALYGGIAARLAGVPAVVSTLTGLGHLYTAPRITVRALRELVTRTLRLSFGHPNIRVTFQNSTDRELMVMERAVSPDRTVVIKGSGVNLSVFTPRPEADGPPVVLMAARLLWTKGVGDFVAAAAALKARGVRARFILVGEPDYGHPSAVASETLQRWEMDGSIEWLRWQDDMAAVLALGHVICLPSSYGEGVPRVLLEAAACGRPIVAVDWPGTREIVHHGRNGLLVPGGNIGALADAIAQLLDNPELRARMGAAGREIVAADFSAEGAMRANVAVYRSVLNLPPDGSLAVERS